MPKITSISFPGINDRIVEFIDHKHLNKNKVETLCGFTHRYLTTAGDTITEDKAMKLIEVFPEINKEWLLYGKGEMITNDYEKLYAKQESDNWRVDVFKRLEQVLASLHMTIEDYEKRYDIIRGTHKNAIKRGRPEVIFGWINGVLSKTPDYSYDWAIYGEGPKKRIKDKAIPLIDQNALASNKSKYDEDDKPMIIPQYATATFAYMVTSDSLRSQNICRGDILICRELRKIDYLDQTSLHLCCIGDAIIISAISRDKDSDTIIFINSRKEVVDTVKCTDIKRIAVVQGIIHGLEGCLQD